jgi:type IV pilus assembly protein PilV
LAIGLLGLLSLQMVSLKNNHSAQLRTTAIVHAYDILDRIRLNKSADYTVAIGATVTGTGLKNLDLAEWKANLATDLPSGDGSISYPGTADIVTVTVQWNDERGTSGVSNQSFTVSTQR